MDKTYLIVGGTSGIGAALAKKLLERGHRVLVCSRSAKASQAATGIQSFTLDAVADTIPEERLPDQLAGVAYCPGTIRLRPFHRLKDEDFLEDFRINCLGAARVLRACLPRMEACSGGASALLFSTVAVQTGMAFHASIAAAKGAVEGLTRSLAAEWAPRIRVNAIAPSLTDTSLGAFLLANDAKRKAAGERHPLKRVGTPENMADAAWFLLSDEASWITGQVFHVDGGMSSIRQF